MTGSKKRNRKWNVTGMHQGKIVEYIDQGKIVCALCLQDKGGKLHLLTLSNREVNLSPKRAVLISGGPSDLPASREGCLEKLRETEYSREHLKNQINIQEFWELVRDEEQGFGHKYLAQLAFGDEISDDHLSALIRALFENRLYFKMKNNQFLPNSEERVSEIIRQKEEEAHREQRLQQGSAWLKRVLSGEDPPDPDFKEELVELLIQLALYGSDAAEFKYGKDLLSRAGITETGRVRDLLETLGIWEKDENLDILRLQVDVEFTEDQMEASRAAATAEPDGIPREDLRDLPAMTIDGPLTRDFDDALSLEFTADGARLGIHISDVTSIIPPGSVLDRMAAERGASAYLPRRQIPMIPAGLSQDVLSLKEGEERRAISLLARFSRDGTLLEHRFVPSFIRVQRRMTYEEVNEAISREPVLQEMQRLSDIMRGQRLERGALNLSLPELQITVHPDSAISLAFSDQNTPSRMIVAECMILYNTLAARVFRDNKIPILYRTQSEPSELLSNDDAGYLYYVFKQRRKLSPLQIDTTPAPHTSLGLDAYIHATSPIRRYMDILSQRQLMNFLRGDAPLYDADKLKEIQLGVTPVLRNLEMLRRKRERYWLLKFLSRNRDKIHTALVLDELKTKYRIVLKEFQMIAEIKRQEGSILRAGQEILVKTVKADPRDDVLKLEFAE